MLIFTFTVVELWFLIDLKRAFDVFFVLQLMKHSTSGFQICTTMLFKYKCVVTDDKMEVTFNIDDFPFTVLELGFLIDSEMTLYIVSL